MDPFHPHLASKTPSSGRKGSPSKPLLTTQDSLRGVTGEIWHGSAKTCNKRQLSQRNLEVATKKQPIIPSPRRNVSRKKLWFQNGLWMSKDKPITESMGKSCKMLPLDNLGTFANPLKQLATASNFLGFGAKNPSAAHDFESVLSCFKSLPPSCS